MWKKNAPADLELEAINRYPILTVLATEADIAGTTWAVAQQVFIAPHDFEISRLQKQVEMLQKQLDEEKQKTKAAALPPAETKNGFVLQETGAERDYPFNQ